MKRVLLTMAAFGLFALPAMAADLAPRPVYKAPVPVWSWTGFYIGGTAGGAWLDSNITASGTTVCNPTLGGWAAGQLQQ
jgi:outer membrane immunogenic protein